MEYHIIDQLVLDSKKFTLENTNYLQSYPAFLKFFKNKKKLSLNDLIIGLNLTYGWMPTILKIKTNDLSPQLRVLNRFKDKGIMPSPDELNDLKSACNNSIVGSSKLMHFIRPDKVPIWDSRVNQYLNQHYNFNKSVNQVKKFIAYRAFCEEIISEKKFSAIKKRVQKKFDHPITDYRALEQLMFHSI